MARRVKNLIIVNTAKLINHANRPTTYATLLHENLHLLFPGGHAEVAKKLGIYKDFSHLGSEMDDLASSGELKRWIESCYR
jgi:hypothetical protein